ncbi:MAG: hypothetical protein R8G66_21820 [Cytophagales bacterium]|nr:hypothetical protein [Cytophagales bacterium]
MRNEVGILNWRGLSDRLLLFTTVAVALCFLRVSAQAQNDLPTNHGLIFKSFEVEPVNRTSLDISGVLDDPIQSLEFDLALNGFSSFGYIFRALATNGSKIDFLYTPGDGGQFKVIIDGRETPLNLAIKPEEVRRNFWRPIRLTFRDSELSLTSGDQIIVLNILENLTIAKLIFGVNDLPDLQTVDCPPFMIRDLKISVGESKYHWPANEVQGAKVKDIIGGTSLEVVNGEWRAAQSFHWKEMGEMTGPMSLVVGHDPIRQRVLWVHPEGIQSYDLTNGYATQFELTSDIESRFGLFDPLNDQMITYDMEPIGVSQFRVDTLARLLGQKANPREPIQNLWLSAPFINPLDSNLMLLGGYGFFTSKNTLWAYDQSTQEWSLIPLSGDTLAPRYHHAISKGAEQGQFYVFGGIGNLTGKQELGLQHYYDLYLLDMRTATLQKLWELPDINSHFSVVNQMVFSKEEEVLYVLGYRAFGEVNNLALMKLSISEASIQVVGDSIPFVQKGFDRTQAGLFQNDKTSELIAYTLGVEDQQARLKLFSILFPPEKAPLSASSDLFRPKWYWFAILLLVFLIAAFVRRTKATNSNQIKHQPLKESDKNAIRLWGGFTVFDKEGANHSDQFSPKIKELFLVLFFNSIGEAQGIKAQKVYEKVWPGYERAKAKNALGVTMGRLRSALQEVESVQVVNENGAWKLDWKNELPTDYHLTMLSLEQLKQQFSEETLDGLITVVGRGPFLPNTEIEWLDDYKGKVNFHVTSSLMEISEKVSEEDRKIRLADVILTIDDLHEQAARLKIGSLTTLGKHGLASYFYEEFAKKYKELYQEQFPKSFKEMNSSNS